MVFILFICITLSSSVPPNSKRSFPYEIKTKNFLKQKNNDVKMTLFTSKNGDTQDSIVQNRNFNTNEKKFDQRPRITGFANNQVPKPTSNPFLTNAEITVTTGVEIPTVVTTVTSQSTTIENSTLTEGFTLIDKYTETFTKEKGTFTLTYSKIKELVPTQINYTTAVNTSALTATLTVSKIVSLTHTFIESYTSQLSTYSYNLPEGNLTVSEIGIIYTNNTIQINTTTFTIETNTEVYTELSKTYTWTLQNDVAAYLITHPLGFTKTLVSPNVTVTISGVENITLHSAKVTQTNVTVVHTYTLSPFPNATEIPTPEPLSEFFEDVLTLAYTQTKIKTDVAYASTTSCEAKGVLPTWTLAPTYISTFIDDPKSLYFTLTKTDILQRVLTEIKNYKCNDIIVGSAEVTTNILTVTNTTKQIYTNTIIAIESSYLSPQKIETNVTYIANLTELTPGAAYTTTTMTVVNSLVGNDENDFTFVAKYTGSYTVTNAVYSTTVTAYVLTEREESFESYSPVPSKVKISTLSLTRLAKNEEILTPVKRRDSVCTNFLSENTTSISNTVIYTYVDYLTLVTFVNTEKINVIVSELGNVGQVSIESVNIMQSHSQTSIQTVKSIPDGITVVEPGSSITNSLLRTKSYTATYITGPIDFQLFEDQCAFKSFTKTMTTREFPTITVSEYESITIIPLDIKEMKQTKVASLYTVYTYGYTILGSTPTYVLADFIYHTMSYTIIYPEDKMILGTRKLYYQTAIGSVFKSETFTEFVPYRTAFPPPKKGDLNPYYTELILTFTTAKGISTTSSTIYARNITITEETVTNLMVSTTLFTETFFAQDDTYTYGYSATDVLVPTQIHVKSRLETEMLTYHKIKTTFLSVVHTSFLTESIVNTYSTGVYNVSTTINTSSYVELNMSVCLHEFEVTETTSAYTYANVYSTYLWTLIEDTNNVTYTISMLKDYIVTEISPVKNEKVIAYYASYSCLGNTTVYSNTLSETEVINYTTYSAREFPEPTAIPPLTHVVDNQIITNVITFTFTESLNTYFSEIRSAVCTEQTNTVTLSYLETFKRTFTRDNNSYIQTYMGTTTIAFTIVQLKINETLCNEHILKPTITNTQIYTITVVEDARSNSRFKESITTNEVQYIAPKAVEITTTYTLSHLILDVEENTTASTLTYLDLQTFVQIGGSMTFVETFTASPTSTELFGPTTAEVISKINTNAYNVYANESSNTYIQSVVYIEKDPQELTNFYINNPCIREGSGVVEGQLRTFTETYSTYSIIATFVNYGSQKTTITNIGIYADINVLMAAFFSTVTIVKSNTVVKSGSTIVEPGSSITNYITTTYTLTQVYIDAETKYNQFTDLCLLYNVTEKETIIPIPELVNTVVTVAKQTSITVSTPSDVEYITLLEGVDYKEGLTLHGETPTRTYSLFNSFTYIISFIEKTAIIYELGEENTQTVVEIPKKTLTFVINAPPPDGQGDGISSKTTSIVVGIIVPLIVIAAIVAAIFIWKHKNSQYTLMIDEDSDQSVLSKEQELIHESRLITDFSDTEVQRPIDGN